MEAVASEATADASEVTADVAETETVTVEVSGPEVSDPEESRILGAPSAG